MKKFIITFMLLTFVAILPFSVSADSVGSDTLMILKELAVMEGDQNGSLNLENNVTRAEFTKMAVKASKYRNSVALNLNISPFRDVTYKMWHAPFVKTASENALIKGYSDGSFRPDNIVLYEEAVTVLLRLLGYTDDDFGVSWPYGQMGIANSIGLCDNVGSTVGAAMNRNDVAVLFGNFLRTNSKGTTTEYINVLDYTVVDDVILVATSNEDTSVGSNKIFTSAGTYKINSYFNYGIVGQRGTALIKNQEELVLFSPDNQLIHEYTVYQALSDNIIVTGNNEFVSLDVDNNLTVYNKSSKTSLNALISQLSAGDTITTYANTNGILDYGIVKTGGLKGPYTVKGTVNFAQYGLSSPTILKDGSKVTASDVEANDIMYYSEKLNTVWLYSDTVTGVYEKATPNRDSLTTVTVSGVQYEVEGVDAFSQLASGGKYNYGDTVTLLLGKDGAVASVKDLDSKTSENVYGFLAETGTRNFTDGDGTYSSFYAKVVGADGRESTYATKSDYSVIKNRIVKVTFSDKYAVLTTSSSSSGISGLFSESGNTIGRTVFSDDISILEVSTNEASETASYSAVYPSRLNGITLKSSQILYAAKNTLGAIDKMIILNVTGDLSKYGIVTSANADYDSDKISGSYTVDINGTTANASGKIFSVTKWQPCEVVYSGNSIDSLIPLKKHSTAAKNINEISCTISGTEYLLSPFVTAYVRSSDQSYRMISLKDLIDGQDNYSVYAYYDASAINGGRIRILAATPK